MAPPTGTVRQPEPVTCVLSPQPFPLARGLRFLCYHTHVKSGCVPARHPVHPDWLTHSCNLALTPLSVADLAADPYQDEFSMVARHLQADGDSFASPHGLPFNYGGPPMSPAPVQYGMPYPAWSSPMPAQYGQAAYPASGRGSSPDYLHFSPQQIPGSPVDDHALHVLHAEDAGFFGQKFSNPLFTSPSPGHATPGPYPVTARRPPTHYQAPSNYAQWSWDDERQGSTQPGPAGPSWTSY